MILMSSIIITYLLLYQAFSHVLVLVLYQQYFWKYNGRYLFQTFHKFR